jgi:predicted metal-binding protein/cyclopropane fatty-acyl-phospholipid synthase-like methyltransferase
MHRQLGFQKADPAYDGFQYIEDLATAYWYSEILFTALDLKLFMYLDQGLSSVSSLAKASSSREPELYRLLRGMERMALISCVDTYWMNNPIAARYLVPGKPDYMGGFFHYRRYMQPNWNKLTAKIMLGAKERKKEEEKEKETLSYAQRNFLYVSAMDTLARQKAKEIADCLKAAVLDGPVLDIGGGAGSMLRALQNIKPDLQGVVFDIPEVIEAARGLYPDQDDWLGISTLAGDFRSTAVVGRFGLIILSNFLHAYGSVEARQLLLKAFSLLKPGGLILIHDYFPDRKGSSPQKGALYDLSMMLNTFDGACHETSMIFEWLRDGGIGEISIRDLGSDTSLILAGGDPQLHVDNDPWIDLAIELGFQQAVTFSPQDVVTGSWVQLKCRFGCAHYGKNFQCPPHAMVYSETRKMLDGYSTTVLLQGQPPGKSFHEKLLKLEKRVFLDGYYKAFVFGAGPCPVCPECPEDGKCRHHNLARPAMEGSGIDVYATTVQAGWSLAPVKEKDGYIKYIGLLLVK